MTVFNLPVPKVSLGDDDEAVVVAQWLVDEGAQFAEGDALVEVETAKATMEIEAPQAGVLVTRRAHIGDSLLPGDVLAVLAVIGEEYEVESETVSVADDLDSIEQEVPRDGAQDFDLPGEFYGLPARRRTNRGAVTAPVMTPSVQRAPLSRHRRALAQLMVRSAVIPQFSVHRDLPMDEACRTVATLREAGVPTTLTDVVLKAAAETLLRHPEANALLIDDDCHRYAEPAIALAADSPAGVVAPVLRNCADLGWAALARERKRAVDGARNGRLLPADLSGATFSVSNVGALGGDAVVPMLTPPQVAILGLGRVRPSWGGSVATAVLVADHRVLDGADAARFLATLAEVLASITDKTAAAERVTHV